MEDDRAVWSERGRCGIAIGEGNEGGICCEIFSGMAV